MTPATDFIKLFWRNLHCWQYTASGFGSCYTDWGINYAKKSFMKSTPVVKLVTSVIYGFSY